MALRTAAPFVLMTTALSAQVDRTAPAFTVSLDAQPEDRWGQVGLGIIDYHGGFNNTFLPALEWLDSQVPASAWEKLDPLMDALQVAYGEYDAELKGFFATVATAYPWTNSSGLFTLPKVWMRGVDVLGPKPFKSLGRYLHCFYSSSCSKCRTSSVPCVPRLRQINRTVSVLCRPVCFCAARSVSPLCRHHDSRPQPRLQHPAEEPHGKDHLHAWQ